MSITEVHAAPWNTIALLIVKVALAAVFAAGGAKVYGEPGMVEIFETIGLGQWFRYVTGAFLILIPALSGLGALLLCCIMIGATLGHLFVLPGSSVPAIVLFMLSGMVVFAERRRLDALFVAANR
jgi:putative oxidoreductase